MDLQQLMYDAFRSVKTPSSSKIDLSPGNVKWAEIWRIFWD